MRRPRLFDIAVYVGLVAAALSALPALAEPDVCPQSSIQPLQLPHVRDALARKTQLVIVTIGSSSTQGWRASDMAHTYPALLQERLMNDLPGTHVAVLNRGIGGQDAAEEVSRLQTDTLAARPQLVIWQVGANGVLRATEPALFGKLINAGLDVLLRANTDVILMDNQRAPRILELGYNAIDKVLADISKARNVNLFSRSKMMDEWRHEGAPYANFIAPDRLHHNNLGYRCLAAALAQSMESAITPNNKTNDE